MRNQIKQLKHKYYTRIILKKKILLKLKNLKNLGVPHFITKICLAHSNADIKIKSQAKNIFQKPIKTPSKP